MTKTIGIDLGTTNSLVGAMTVDGPILFANELNEELIPSCVALSEENTWMAGSAAKNRIITKENAGKAFFKRDVGTQTVYDLDGKKISPTECSAMVLRELKRIAELKLGEEVTNAVITVPAYFHDSQRNATVEAAKIAGLNVKRILNEPTAAALAYGYDNPEEEKHFLVFDLGGGTFDVSILEVFDGVIEIISSGGESRLGGEDYTNVLLEHVIKNGPFEIDEKDRERLRQKVEVVKQKLSVENTANLEYGDKSMPIDRTLLEELTQDLSQRIRQVIQRCMRDANLSKDQIDDILLVGGASRMQNLHALLTKELEKFPNVKIDPDRVVAKGAIVQAALCDKDEGVNDIVLTDICPHTLGIAVTRQISQTNFKEGLFEPIIERNTMVPTSKVKPFNTLHPQQDEVKVCIYQGENRMVDDNTLLGELNVRGLRCKPNERNGGEFDVRFSYDMNGILEVDVTITKNNKKVSKIIEQRPGSLSPDEIKEAIKRMAPLKVHPKDKLENRATIERANRLYPELSGEHRDQLSGLMDQFERSLDLQDSSDININRTLLEQYMEPFFKIDQN